MSLRKRISGWIEGITHWLVSWVVIPPILVDETDEAIRRHAIVIDNSGIAVPILVQETMPLFSLGPGGGPKWLKVPARYRSRRAYLCGPRRQMSKQQYEKYLRKMMAAIKDDHGKSPKGVAIVIHGGNERVRKMVKKSIALRPKMVEYGYYPIFIDWDSNMKRAYVEQLVRIQSGRYTLLALPMAPFKLLVDALRSIANLLPAWALQVQLMFRSSRWYTYETTENLDRFQPPPPNIEVVLGGWRPGWTFWRLLQLIPAFFFQILIVLPVVGLWVPRAWENLLRRVRAMYRAPGECDPKAVGPGYQMPDGTEFKKPEGAMALFLEALRKTVDDLGMDVTIFAHSMGAMVANETLYRAGDLPYKSIVYMAPACGVRDFDRAVQPVLKRRAGKTEAFVLTLHPRVEAGQRDCKGWVGPGSVLEWLEGILAPPFINLDRALGKWDNALRTLHVFEPAVRKHLHIMGFSYCGKDPAKPRRHVDFDDVDAEFWKQESWRRPKQHVDEPLCKSDQTEEEC